MKYTLEFYAGREAYQQIKDGGLTQQSIKVIAGAAGGPKWLVLGGIDRALINHFLKKRKEPLFLIGSSIGAWRFSAFAQKKPMAAIQRFRELYISQRYSSKPTTAEVSAETLRIMNAFITPHSIREILSHPFMRMNMFVTRIRAAAMTSKKIPLGAYIGCSMLGNLASRRSLRLFYERTLFYDGRDKPPFYQADEFPPQRVRLSAFNLEPALQATGAIPLVMKPVMDIPGARPGAYVDGGVIDYHLDIPFMQDDGIVLYPHFANRIIPGWFDKSLVRRTPHPENFDRVLMVCPSREFVDNLPLKKIPDRNDFFLFKGKDDERIAYWNTVVEKSNAMGDEFMEVISGSKIKSRIRPLS